MPFQTILDTFHIQFFRSNFSPFQTIWIKGVFSIFTALYYRVFIWNLGKLIVYYSGLFSVIWAKTYDKICLCIGHFSRFIHNSNIVDTDRNIELFFTKSLEEKNEGNTLLKLLNSGSESCFHLYAYFFLSYGLILYLLKNDVLNFNLL